MYVTVIETRRDGSPQRSRSVYSFTDSFGWVPSLCMCIIQYCHFPAISFTPSHSNSFLTLNSSRVSYVCGLFIYHGGINSYSLSSSGDYFYPHVDDYSRNHAACIMAPAVHHRHHQSLVARVYSLSDNTKGECGQYSRRRRRLHYAFQVRSIVWRHFTKSAVQLAP